MDKNKVTSLEGLTRYGWTESYAGDTAAPGGSKQLEAGTVLRFQNLDAFVDADLDAHPSRGEFKASKQEKS